MPGTTYVAQCFVKIGGQNAPEQFYTDLLGIVVDSSVGLPAMFTMTLIDEELTWADDARLDLGKTIDIDLQMPADRGSTRGTLIKGEITSLEPSFSGSGETRMVVRGYDRSHRLHRGKKTRTFLKQKDSELAQKIASEAGLSPQIDSTSVRYDYVLQKNQTNMEFLQERAERIGFQVFAADGKLYFKKGEADLGDGPELTLGQDLLSFRPSFKSSGQADKVVVKGWDPKKKAAIKGEATPDSRLNQGGMTSTGGDAAKEAFGAAEAVVVHDPVFSVDEAKALATGLSQDISKDFVEAEGTALGRPDIVAGKKVTIKGVGTRFGGKYFVTSATHTWSSASYETHFSISGRQPNTISHLLQSDNGHEDAKGVVPGVATALVTNVNDPENLGRVKVKYPWLGDDIESDWMRMAVPMAGNERGFYYLPEVNDEVLVAFEHGDVHRPCVLGGLWSSSDKPPKPTSAVVKGGTVNERIIKSRSGHLVILDDTSGKEQIIIRDKTGSNEMVIDSAKNNMTIKVNGDFTVEAKGKINLKSTMDFTLESSANGKIKTGANLTAEATANGTFKANAQLELNGTAMSTLKGATVSVQGQAMTEVKGALVKIN